jgi:putative ABC transport system permease protein
VLVAVQVTLAIVLLVGAGLMMRTLLAIQQIDPGLNPKNVLVGQLSFPENQPQTPAQRAVFLQRLLDKVRVLPGVAAASPGVGVPLRGGPSSPLAIDGTTPTAKWRAVLDFVGEEYFRVVGLPLINGRLLSSDDVQGGRRVTVVNQQLVEEFLAGASPIGRTVTFAALDRGAPQKRTPFEIVGVVGDARNSGLQEPVRPQAFLPYTIPGFQAGLILLRTTVTPDSLQHGVRQQIWAVDQNVAITHVGGAYGTLSLEQIMYRDAMAAPAFGVGLLGTFAAIGLILSAIGVYSVIAYSVSLQTHEIGIRMALGAEPRGVMRLIVLKGLQPIAAGVLLGLGASYGLTRVLASNIYGVTPTDPWTFAAVVVVLTSVGLFACVVPARRAMRVDPLIALRCG